MTLSVFIPSDRIHLHGSKHVKLSKGGESVANKKDDESRKRLLVIKDSYANALLPYLCHHYDITAIDPRYFAGDIDTVIKEICPAEILVTVGADTLQRELFISLLSEDPLGSGTVSS